MNSVHCGKLLNPVLHKDIGFYLTVEILKNSVIINNKRIKYLTWKNKLWQNHLMIWLEI